MASLDDLLAGSRSLEELFGAYPTYVAGVMGRMDAPAFGRFAAAVEATDAAGGTLYLVGNGGAAAQCSHLANDLMLGLRADGRPGLRVVSLADNAAVLTAAANDRGYESALTDQLEALLRPEDLVLAMSASGNSENVVRAVEHARAVGAQSAAWVGFDGGRLLGLVDHPVHVPTDAGEYGPVEDVFCLLDHLLTLWLLQRRG